MDSLAGKVAIVTGGARGMGEGHVRALVERGANVLATDVLDEEGMALAGSLGDQCHFLHLDVTNEAQWDAAIAYATKAFGGVDWLVNNAGITILKGVEDINPQEFRKVVDVNLTGPWLGMRAVAPAMRARGGGAIINVSSTAGMIGFPGTAPYVASKWGLRGITKAAALELGKDNIRVVSLHPGAIRSPMAGWVTDDMFKYQPIGRIGETDEVSKMVVFLLAEGTYSTGSEFQIDGGSVLMGPGRIPR